MVGSTRQSTDARHESLNGFHVIADDTGKSIRRFNRISYHLPRFDVCQHVAEVEPAFLRQFLILPSGCTAQTFLLSDLTGLFYNLSGTVFHCQFELHTPAHQRVAVNIVEQGLLTPELSL